MSESSGWKYCVVGNIVKTHVDKEGVLRFGTPAYTGGTKVYLQGKYWEKSSGEIPVIGLSRGKKYQVNNVAVELIENVRFQRTFQPIILALMDNWEFSNCWWHCSKEDKEEALKFVWEWNIERNGSAAATK